MALYTKLDDKTLGQITSNYDIGIIQSWKVLEGGAENTNHLLITNKGQFVLTICERKTLEETTILANLLKHLENHKFTTTIIIPNNKREVISFYQNKPVLLKAYIQGTVEENIPNQLLGKIGKSIAQLHQIPVPNNLPTQYSYGQQSFKSITRQKIQHPFVEWLSEMHQFILENLPSDLPKALIHGDIFPSNLVITVDKTPIIMDFEEACYYYRLYDLGMAIVGLCRKQGIISWQKVSLLIDGYEEKVSLLSIERNYLNHFIIYAATATAFWRFRQFNILAPTEAFKDTYLDMVNVADNVKNKIGQTP